jgi:hypothetical protein
MNPPNPFVVKRDRIQLAILSFGALVFIALGVWMVQVDPNESTARYSPFYIRTLGVASIVFFGACFLVGTRHLFSLGAAMVIDDKGILDRASAMRAGRIPWSDIKGFAGRTIAGKKMLVIRLSDPDKYLRRSWPWMRPIHRYNIKKCGSPVMVISDVLRISFNELIATCRHFHQQCGQGPGRSTTEE